MKASEKMLSVGFLRRLKYRSTPFGCPPNGTRTSLSEGDILETRKRSFHRMMVNGVNAEYLASDSAIGGDLSQIIDFDNWSNNDWLAANQFTVTENLNNRWPDIVLFVNSLLSLGIIELKLASRPGRHRVDCLEPATDLLETGPKRPGWGEGFRQ